MVHSSFLVCVKVGSAVSFRYDCSEALLKNSTIGLVPPVGRCLTKDNAIWNYSAQSSKDMITYLSRD